MPIPMMNIMIMFDDILNNRYPFDTDILNPSYRGKLESSIDDGIDFILKSLIEVDGAVAWFDDVKLEGKSYISRDENKEFFVDVPNGVSWYRFYNLQTMEPIFSGRDGIVKGTIQEIEEERQYGYSWGGDWPNQLVHIMHTVGYFPNKFYAQVVGTNSADPTGQILTLEWAEEIKPMEKDISLEVSVKIDGSGDYKTVQAAIDAVPGGNTIPFSINIGKGTFREVLNISSDKGFITLVGEGPDQTIITFDNYAGKDNGRGGIIGTSGSATAYLFGKNFTARNLTFENSFDETLLIEGRQAVAVKSEGDQSYFEHVRFVGNQDTLYANKGRQYFKNCIIEGDVDFIFGAAQAVFESCEIVSLDRGSDENNGYVTAASTLIGKEYGYLFLDCNLTSLAKAETVYLGRPWHPGGSTNAIASVVFKDCTLGAHIKTAPWTDMGFSWKDARFFESGSKGPGAGRNNNRPQLSAEEAVKYTKVNILDGWNP